MRDVANAAVLRMACACASHKARVIAPFIIASLLFLLSACASPAKTSAPAAAILGATPIMRTAGAPLSTDLSQDALASGVPRLSSDKLYPGSGVFVGGTEKAANAAIDGNGDVTLNFIDADVRDVLRAVLGDALALNYSVDPNVQGKMTLQTATPITREAVLPTLEAALKLNGVALVSRNGIYAAVPVGDAQRRSGVPQLAGTSAHGYGLEIVQLKYVSVADIQKVLSAVAPQGGVVYSDEARNLLILSGTGEEISTLIDTIALFDVDYLKSVSFGVFTPANVTVDVLAKELQDVLGDADNPIAKLLKFIPLPRINALLVIAKQPALLDDVKVWTKRLDIEGQGSTRRVYLYRIQNAKAANLASTLGKLFGTESSGGAASLDGATSLTGASGLAPPTGDVFSGSNAASAAGYNAGAPAIVTADGMRIVADEANNMLVILATPREYKTIENALKNIDIAPDQVLIEASIAEVTLNDQFKFGVQWFFKDDKNTATSTSLASGAIASVFPGFSYTYLVPDVKIALNALATLTEVKVISSPKIMVLDNQAADLQVGDDVPVSVQSSTSTSSSGAPIVSTIEYRQTGVLLKVTPRINKSGLVIMDVSQEVSDVAPTTTSGIDSPTIQQRKFTSTVAVQDGTTVALGGLIRDNASHGNGGVPWLKDIPGVGAAFRNEDNSTKRTELLVFMTPRIVRNAQDAKAMTDYLREQLRDANLVSDSKNR